MTSHPFDTDGNGNPIPNACLPCAQCGRGVPLVILEGDGLDLIADPVVRVLCSKCWIEPAA